MRGFNNMLNKLSAMTGQDTTDTTSGMGEYGQIDTPCGCNKNEEIDSQEDKIIIMLDSGVEIHLPSSVYEMISSAVNGKEVTGEKDTDEDNTDVDTSTGTELDSVPNDNNDETDKEEK